MIQFKVSQRRQKTQKACNTRHISRTAGLSDTLFPSLAHLLTRTPVLPPTSPLCCESARNVDGDWGKSKRREFGTFFWGQKKVPKEDPFPESNARISPRACQISPQEILHEGGVRKVAAKSDARKMLHSLKPAIPGLRSA